MSERRGSLPVDGASIHYEVRGTGPPLLLVQGGLHDAGATDQLADALATASTVISYDRRGLSRSPADDTPTTIERHADDAAALLDAIADGPAAVVGASIGALIGVHLVARAPERVRVLVAHEPPMEHLVPDPETAKVLDRIAHLARTNPFAAIGLMADFTGGSDTEEPDARPSPPAGNTAENVQRFLAHDLPAVRASTLDPRRIIDAGAADRVVPTGGVESRGRWEYRCAQRLADELGRTPEELPGGHNGLVSHPWATAAALPPLLG